MTREHLNLQPGSGIDMALAQSGSPLVDLRVDETRRAELKEESQGLETITLTGRQAQADLELLANGAFSPLTGFMNEAEYTGVRDTMKLPSGEIWPIPITLDVSQEFAENLSAKQRVAIRHPEGNLLGVITIENAYEPDRLQEAEAVYGTTDDAHPGVFRLLHGTKPVYVGGPVEIVDLPPHHTFKTLRATPAEVREHMRRHGWERTVAFQTRNPMHRAHVELTRRAMEEANAKLLIQPAVGPTQPGDIDPAARVRCYQGVLGEYPDGDVMLNLLPLAMRMAGPREAVLHAAIRKNYGATHFIVGRDHAGPRSRKTGKPFYAPEAAQQMALAHQNALRIKILPFDEMVYVPTIGSYVPRPEVPQDAQVLSISGSQQREMLRNGQPLPNWFTPPDVARVLERLEPPNHERGMVLFFTGLSGSGKSTVAQIVEKMIHEHMYDNGAGRSVISLDGDVVRTHLSKGLGFTKDDRAENVRRVGFVASQVAKARGIAVAALIAPDGKVRDEVRNMVAEQGGNFIEVHVSTPLEECERRDRKGLYAKARAGEIKGFTGIDDPYDVPEHPELVLDTSGQDPEVSAQVVFDYLVEKGYIKLPQSAKMDHANTND